MIKLGSTVKYSVWIFPFCLSDIVAGIPCVFYHFILKCFEMLVRCFRNIIKEIFCLSLCFLGGYGLKCFLKCFRILCDYNNVLCLKLMISKMSIDANTEDWRWKTWLHNRELIIIHLPWYTVPNHRNGMENSYLNSDFTPALSG